MLSNKPLRPSQKSWMCTETWFTQLDSIYWWGDFWRQLVTVEFTQGVKTNVCYTFQTFLCKRIILLPLCNFTLVCVCLSHKIPVTTFKFVDIEGVFHDTMKVKWEVGVCGVSLTLLCCFHTKHTVLFHLVSMAWMWILVAAKRTRSSAESWIKLQEHIFRTYCEVSSLSPSSH